MTCRFIVAGLRATVVAVVSLGLVTAPMAQAFAATTVAPRTIGELKTARQFQIEAARYDRAVKAIGSISTMSLRTPADLEAAGKIVRMHAPSLKLLTSKLVTAAYQDQTFTLAIARNFRDERTAKAFAGRLMADYKSVQQLDGAQALGKRLGDLTNANAAVLQKAADALRAATARITGKDPVIQPHYLTQREAYGWTLLIIAVLFLAALTFPALAIGVAAWAALFAPVAVAAFLTSPITAIVVALYGGAIIAAIVADEEEPPPDTSAGSESAAVANCVDAALERNEQCLEDASELPAADRAYAQFACASQLAAEQAFCSLAGIYQ